MIEIDYQKLLVDAVRQDGGFAFKMANRFLGGIPDLLIQLPTYTTWLWEVKFKARRPVKPERVPLRPLQYKFMTDYVKAGGLCGVVSFFKDDNDLYALAVPYDNLQFKHESEWYTLLPRGEREQTLVGLIKAVYDERL